MEKSIYYNYDKVFSYNALLNIIIGGRGIGKTYGLKTRLIKRFLKTGRKFAYIRRYDSDLDASVGSSINEKFFEQVYKEFPEAEYKISKHKKVRSLFINGQVCGYALPLSSADSLKSSTYEDVDIIVYDEFMLKEGSSQHYLKNEPEIILDLIETIGRMRDIKIFCLGNAISSTCPLMTYFDLTLPYNNDIKLYKDGLILVQYVDNKEFIEAKKQTRFGKLIEGTRYGKYAIDNEFLTESKWFIKKKNKDCRFAFIMYLNGKEFGVWKDYKNYEMYISNDIDPNCPVKFTISNDDHKNDTILVRARYNPNFKAIVEYYRIGKLNFENQQIKNIVMNELLRYVY